MRRTGSLILLLGAACAFGFAAKSIAIGIGVFCAGAYLISEIELLARWLDR